MAVVNINTESEINRDFRRVISTTEDSQLVLMTLLPGQAIGSEIHEVDQYINIVSGQGLAVLDNKSHSLYKGSMIIIPSGTRHDIINNGFELLKLYTIYTGVLHGLSEIQAFKPIVPASMRGIWYVIAITKDAHADIPQFYELYTVTSKTNPPFEILQEMRRNGKFESRTAPPVAWSDKNYAILVDSEGPFILSRTAVKERDGYIGTLEQSVGPLLGSVIKALGFSSDNINIVGMITKQSTD